MSSHYLRPLPPADDDTHIALNLHDTYTYPPLKEGWPLGGGGIHFDRILHQKKCKKSFQLSPSEVPLSKRKKTVSNADQGPFKISPSHSVAHSKPASERHGMVRHRFPVLRELLLRHIPRWDILVRLFVDLWI